MAKMDKEARKAALKSALYNTAIAAFRSHGYEATKTQDIIEQVGVSKGTFFNYFPSKQSILEQYFAELTYRAIAKTASTNFSSARQATLGLCINLTDAVQHDDALFRTVCALAQSDKAVKEQDNVMDNTMVDLLVTHVKEDQASKVLKTFDCQTFAFVILDIITTTARQCAAMNQLSQAAEVMFEKINLLFDLAEVAHDE